MPECHMSKETCTFRCTGYDGGHVWKKIHDAAESIECEECRVHGKQLMSGVHDLVNVGLGKNPHDAGNFKKFADEVKCALDRCTKDGRC